MDRPIGIEEYLVWAYGQAAPNHFTVTAKILGELTIEQLRDALIWVQQRHPFLRGKIALDQSGYPWFVEEVATIPLRVVKRQSEQQWQQEVEQELAHPLDWNQAPLIRMVLVHAADVSELIITCHHILADGMSTVYLLRDILQAIGLQNHPQPVLPKHLAYEHLTVIAPKIQPLTQQPPLQWSNPSNTTPTLPENSRPRLLAWSLSPETTTNIIQRCQQEQTSVHAAICAAFLLAVYQQNDSFVLSTQTQDPNQPATLRCFTPINIRQLLAPTIQEDFGTYYTTYVTDHPITPDLTLWDFARAIKAQLKQKMVPDQIFAHLPKAEAFVSTRPSADVVKEVLRSLNSYDLLVSNLGRLNIPTQYGGLQLAAIYGPSATTHIKSDRFVGVSTLGEQMFFNLVYSESDISPTLIQQLQQEAMQLLTTSSMPRVLHSC